MKTTWFLLCFYLSHALMLQAQNTWTQKADFGGAARRSAIGFSIGAYGYVGTGYNSAFYDDLWRFDPGSNSWMQVAAFPGTARFSAVVFAIGSEAYVGTGYDINNNFNTADFWKYDALGNSWSQSASMPAGQERRYAVAFSAQGRGYVCTGVGPSGYLNDLWQYDAGNNSWLQKANFPGAPRYECVAFNIGEFGYVGCGAFAGTVYTDFFEYQPQNDSWFQRASFPGTGGDAPAGFALEGRGFIGTGSTQGSYPVDFYEWNQADDNWTPKAGFPAPGRAFGTGFSIAGKGYIGLGEASAYYNDWWEYTPDSLQVSVQHFIPPARLWLTCSNGKIVLAGGHPEMQALLVSVFDSNGRLVIQSGLGAGGSIPAGFAPGIYFFSITGYSKFFSGKLFVPGF